MSRGKRPLETEAAACEKWFARQGLPYFVPETRQRARAAIARRKLLPYVVVVLAVALTAGVILAWLGRDLSFAPAALSIISLLAVAFYAQWRLGARPIVVFAVHRTVAGLRYLVPMVTRALPLLLIFVTFLFINAEVWQLASYLDGGLLWLTVLLFGGLAVGFMVVRLPEEVDKVDDRVTATLLQESAASAGLVGAADREVQRRTGPDGFDVDPYIQIRGFERANLILVLLVIQASQVLLLALSVFLFFVFFGALTMNDEVVASWIGQAPNAAPGLSNLSVELLQVSVFLAAFSGLYFTVYVVTDEVYREQFFTGVLAELERAVALRAVYLMVLEDAPSAKPVTGSQDLAAATQRLPPIDKAEP